MVDPNLLENAILNLALNARDAMPDGGTLRITTVKESMPACSESNHSAHGREHQMSVIVEDTGFGMSPDVLSHALEPFFTTKDAGHGNGLGLPMVYGFAKQSNGDLLIDSEEDKGTRVTLTLPCIAEDCAYAPGS